MIAQVLPDPNSAQAVGWLVLTLAGLASAFLVILKIIDHFRKKEPAQIHPQPLAVRVQDPCVEGHAFAKHEEANRVEHLNLHSKIGGVERGANARMDQLRLEIKADLMEAHRQAEERSHRIHERINAVAEEMPKKVIELLDMTGKLKP